MQIQKFEIVIDNIHLALFSLVFLVVDEVSVVPSIKSEHKVFSQEVNDRLESKNNHNNNNLVANILVPSCTEVCVFTFKNTFKIFAVIILNKIHADHHWQNDHVDAEAAEDGKCGPTCLLCYFVETDVGYYWFRHCVEESVVNNDDKRSDNVVTLTELLIFDIVLTNLIGFNL